MNGLQRRLKSLEAAKPVPPPRSSGQAAQARERMKEHLEGVAALRRGELDPEEAADVEAVSAALERRLAASRGEGGS